MKIGFIGLGNMGAPMARNLIKAEENIVGFDVDPSNVDDIPQNSIEVIASECSIIFTMLPDGEILKKVYGELVPICNKGTILVDCSTVDVDSALHVASKSASRGLFAMDAPVSGGVVGAEKGTLTFMVGGDAEAYNKVKHFFGIMGQKSVLCGESGAGQSAKICNNMILGISMIGVCESFNLAEKLNLNWERLYDVVSTSSGSCWSVNTYCPAPGIGPESPADRDYQPGFAADLMLKDLKLAKAAAESVDAPTALGKHATEIYENFLENGGKGRDFSAILPYLAKKL
jgi:3-hydroxyisobutyrate dehydrogenase